MRKILRFKWLFVVGMVIFVLLLVIPNWVIHSKSEKYVFSEMDQTPKCRYALLLGTSKTGRGGGSNAYFFNRIDAVIELYRAKKINYVLVSGDNGRKTYNEPKDMRDALIEAGMPEDHIFLDYAGFSTIESVVRAKKIFGLNRFLIVSQQFHNERAVYLARRNDIEAFGYNAKDVRKMGGFITRVREYFARVKVFTDLWLGAEPTYLGDKIELPKA